MIKLLRYIELIECYMQSNNMNKLNFATPIYDNCLNNFDRRYYL